MTKKEYKDAVWNFKEAMARVRRLFKQRSSGTVNDDFYAARSKELNRRLAEAFAKLENRSK